MNDPKVIIATASLIIVGVGFLYKIILGNWNFRDWLVKRLEKQPGELLETFRLTASQSSDIPKYSRGYLELTIRTPVTLSDVSAAGWHPRVEISTANPLARVTAAAGRQPPLILQAVWASDRLRPKKLTDCYRRTFPIERPMDPGEEWEPLYITFRLESGKIYGAVQYIQIAEQSHGQPEFILFDGGVPLGWVSGRK